jgi:hypothetical protein
LAPQLPHPKKQPRSRCLLDISMAYRQLLSEPLVCHVLHRRSNHDSNHDPVNVNQRKCGALSARGVTKRAAQATPHASTSPSEMAFLQSPKSDKTFSRSPECVCILKSRAQYRQNQSQPPRCNRPSHRGTCPFSSVNCQSLLMPFQTDIDFNGA